MIFTLPIVEDPTSSIVDPSYDPTSDVTDISTATSVYNGYLSTKVRIENLFNTAIPSEIFNNGPEGIIILGNNSNNYVKSVLPQCNKKVKVSYANNNSDIASFALLNGSEELSVESINISNGTYESSIDVTSDQVDPDTTPHPSDIIGPTQGSGGDDNSPTQGSGEDQTEGHTLT